MDINVFSTAEHFIRQQIADGIVPCAVMAARQKNDLRISILNGQGKNSPELRDQAYLLASITKAVVGTLFAILHERNIIRFDDRLCDLLPEMADPADAATTVGNVFTHCTGYRTGVTLIDREKFTPENYFLEILREGRAYPPRTAMEYSTMTYNLLSAAVFRKTGQRLPQLLQEYIFAPARMLHTSFKPSIRRMPVIDWEKSYSQPVEALMDSEMAGAGLWSTLDDLLNLSDALQSGKLISPETLRLVTEVKDPLPMLNCPEKMSRRTWGWNKEIIFPGQPESGFFHGGATGTMVWIDPAEDFTFIFLTNRWCCGNDHAFSILKYFYPGV